MNQAATIVGSLGAALMRPTQAALVGFCCFLFYLWHRLVSPLLGERCRFYPSCSIYAEESLRRYGLVRGLRLTVGRLLRCHPFCEGGIDLVPRDPIAGKAGGLGSRSLQLCCRKHRASTE